MHGADIYQRGNLVAQLPEQLQHFAECLLGCQSAGRLQRHAFVPWFPYRAKLGHGPHIRRQFNQFAAAIGRLRKRSAISRHFNVQPNADRLQQWQCLGVSRIPSELLFNTGHDNWATGYNYRDFSSSRNQPSANNYRFNYYFCTYNNGDNNSSFLSSHHFNSKSNRLLLVSSSNDPIDK